MPTPINISASRGAAILGLSNWKTPVQSWLEIMEARQPGFCEKRGYVKPEFEYSPAMRWGHAFESSIIELAESKINDRIANREFLFVTDGKIIGKTPTIDIINSPYYITCHIDGRYYRNDKELHEGKTTSAFYFRDYFGEPGTDEVPMEYQIQCQHQLICTGAEKVILSVLVFPKRVEEWEEIGIEIIKNGNEYYISYGDGTYIIPYEWSIILNQMGYFHQFITNYNQKLQQKMIEKYTEFWENNILGEKEPEPQSCDDIKALCPEPTGTIIADENIERMYSEYKNIKSELSGSSQLAKRADQIKVDLLNYMRKSDKTLDENTKNKYILLDRSGKRLASYGKNKNGQYMFR